MVYSNKKSKLLPASISYLSLVLAYLQSNQVLTTPADMSDLDDSLYIMMFCKEQLSEKVLLHLV